MKAESSGLTSAHAARARALRSGFAALADHEVLALAIDRGRRFDGSTREAQHLLERHDGLIGLAGADASALALDQAIGPRLAVRLAATFEVGRRVSGSRRRDRPSLRSAGDIHAVVAAELAPLQHEELWCLPLDAHSRLIGKPRVVSRGDVDGTDAGPRAFFRSALTAGASTCIAVHNHPTGDPTPSGADRAVTVRLVAAGRAVDVPLVDHVIIGDGGRYASLRAVDPGLFR